MGQDRARRMLGRPVLTQDQFERYESARDPNQPGVLATREVLVEGDGVSVAAENHGISRGTVHKRLKGILARAAKVGETITVRFQCVGRDPVAFAEALGCDPSEIRWYPPAALADAIGLMRSCAAANDLVWPDLRSALSLLPGAEEFTLTLARFFGESPAAYRASCQELLAELGARTGLVDIELPLPAADYERLEEIAAQTPIAPECPEDVEHNALWEITAWLPYARSRATQRELLDLFRNPTRGRPSEGARAITERIFREVGVGILEHATPGVARAPEGVAAFARMLIQEYPARISREHYMRPVYRREALARALNACRGKLGPRLRSAPGRVAVKRIYLDGVPPNSAFREAGFNSVPARDLYHLRHGLAPEGKYISLHYLTSAEVKPALEAALSELGAEPLAVAAESGVERSISMPVRV
ncbi:hypothetical protein [Sediminicurvatus halobius]|uniref:Uncharacterized protein n=1 Tax=Sediminicurvatus halobius TaxID=2182432 RepID=A0A2U2MXT7_9GAMM|nr:hypothetical protein [Spiribacter halobius]PWG61592.1 hypothetical protein DEM34_15495 [Spiribacter halobius]UEX77270.1 hypothetical protein LMH63_15165 [Spiribacter halobius]